MHRLYLFGLLPLLFTSCASNHLTIKEAGFADGVKHGIFIPFSPIGKYVLNHDVNLYALNNSGLSYWVGFALGCVIVFIAIIMLRRLLSNRQH
jgi:hypothetical protein